MHDNSLPVFTAIATVLMMLASAAQWRARNLGTLLNIGWVLVGNLNFFLNSIIWRDHFEDTAPVFCDISVRFQVATQTAISGASLCVTRRLAAIASSQSINVSQRRKHINLWIDLGCGIGLPALVMATSYIIQGRRFVIWEGYGCEFASTSTIPSLLILLLWPLILSAISAIYGGIAIYHFVSKRLEFRTLLKSSNSGLDTGQFIRLLCLASADIAIAVPLDIYLIISNSARLIPYSWSVTHRDFNVIPAIPADIWLSDTQQTVVNIALYRYVTPMLGCILFVLIGMTEEAIGEYTKLAKRVWFAIPGTRQRKPLLPPPVNLGSTIGRVDGSGPIQEAKSPRGMNFDTVPYDSPTSPRFKDHHRRVGIKVEQEVV